jgi:dihydroxy-acid dehydratase
MLNAEGLPSSTSSSELAICFSHLDGIAKVVKEAVREPGGLPFEIRTAAPSDFIISAGAGGGYMLASRDLIVNDMEIAIEGAQLDGMICLSSCDKTPPAHLMAAGRFNIPSILVICGYQPSGHYEGKHVDIEEVFIGSVQAMFGKLSKETLAGMCDHAITGPGVCAGMGTANSMHIVCEALGMTLPGAAPVLAEQSGDVRDRAPVGASHRRDGVGRPDPEEDSDRRRVPQRCGRGAGGERLDHCIKHLQATAVEAGVDVDVFSLFNELGAQVPVLSAVAPNGAHTIEQFEAAGGARRCCNADAAARPRRATVTGRTLGDDLGGVTSQTRTSSARCDRPIAAPRRSWCCADRSRPRAPSRPGCGRRATDALTGPRSSSTVPDALGGAAAGELRAGQVLVLRGCGPRAARHGGLGVARRVRDLCAGARERGGVRHRRQLSGCATRADGRGGLAGVGVGGPLALVENGDFDRRGCRCCALTSTSQKTCSARAGTLGGEPKLSPATGYCRSTAGRCSRCRLEPCWLKRNERRRRG